MTKKFEITRQIGIDAGHRVTHHGSKCRNLHGHRYTIEATCVGELFESGEQQGMVLDFGFLKDIMMRHIDEPCDHGMMLWRNDPWVAMLLVTGDDMDQHIVRQGYHERIVGASLDNLGGKYYIVPFVPTAENLAKHWFERMEADVIAASTGLARLAKVRVWETPNCFSDYPAK